MRLIEYARDDGKPGPDDIFEGLTEDLWRRGRDFVDRGIAQAPAEYVEDVLSRAVSADESAGTYRLRRAEFQSIRERWTGGKILAPLRTPSEKARNAARKLARRTAQAIADLVAGLTLGVVRLEPIMAPGDWFAVLVRGLSFGRITPCPKCTSRKARMNRAGWRGLPKLWWGWARDQARKDDPG